MPKQWNRRTARLVSVGFLCLTLAAIWLGLSRPPLGFLIWIALLLVYWRWIMQHTRDVRTEGRERAAAKKRKRQSFGPR